LTILSNINFADVENLYPLLYLTDAFIFGLYYHGPGILLYLKSFADFVLEVKLHLIP